MGGKDDTKKFSDEVEKIREKQKKELKKVVLKYQTDVKNLVKQMCVGKEILVVAREYNQGAVGDPQQMTITPQIREISFSEDDAYLFVYNPELGLRFWLVEEVTFLAD